jgi:hypothetical protein
MATTMASGRRYAHGDWGRNFMESDIEELCGDSVQTAIDITHAASSR